MSARRRSIKRKSRIRETTQPQSMRVFPMRPASRSASLRSTRRLASSHELEVGVRGRTTSFAAPFGWYPQRRISFLKRPERPTRQASRIWCGSGTRYSRTNWRAPPVLASFSASLWNRSSESTSASISDSGTIVFGSARDRDGPHISCPDRSFLRKTARKRGFSAGCPVKCSPPPLS